MNCPMREHGISCDSEKIKIEQISEHEKSCSSTTKNISRIPQCFWTPHLAGWC